MSYGNQVNYFILGVKQDERKIGCENWYLLYLMETGRIGFTGIASHFWYKPIPLIVYTLAGGYMSWKYSTLLIRGTGDMNSRISNDKDTVVLP